MQPNSTIGHYHIIRPLGKGGMGAVYLADDTRLKRQVRSRYYPNLSATTPNAYVASEQKQKPQQNSTIRI